MYFMYCSVHVLVEYVCVHPHVILFFLPILGKEGRERNYYIGLPSSLYVTYIIYFVSSVKGCILNPIVDQRRNSFNVQKHFQPPLLPHFIDRAKIYHDVMALFSKDEVLQEYPLKVKFVNEIAYDGGVSVGTCSQDFGMKPTSCSLMLVHCWSLYFTQMLICCLYPSWAQSYHMGTLLVAFYRLA